jgi:methyl-accepting chemotaxis protein
MISKWTFGRIMGAGLSALLALYLLAGAVALACVHNVAQSKDRVIEVDTQLQIRAEQLLAVRADRAASVRGYLLTGDPALRDQAARATVTFNTVLGQVRDLVHTSRGRELVAQVTSAGADSIVAQNALVKLKESGASTARVIAAFKAAAPQRAALQSRLAALSDYEHRLAAEGVASSNTAATRYTWVILVVMLAGVLATAALATALVRRLRTRIGSAVGEVQSSSAELQTTANQQAVGAMEQATAMSEISTTITELLATSRQITESAQRVSAIAEQTATAGGAGQSTVASARQSMLEIRNQVDVIVNHILELGDKSQRIGVVLDIVSELAEQTNILAINSTIEAAGAGEAGKRFAVVADEIRKLADRVAESTKEIRTLIELVRGAVHTTVIATEIGSKAVDAGTAQFAGVAASFEEIIGLVTTTTEAAREIELSTKQQTTAVEQVNFAVANVTQTTKENEAGSTQTLQTASQLAELSGRLRRLIEPVPIAAAGSAGSTAPGDPLDLMDRLDRLDRGDRLDPADSSRSVSSSGRRGSP